MKSLTYNAIITKSTDIINSLFFPKNRNKISFDSFTKGLISEEREDLLILSPGRGYGFLELDVNFPTGGKSKSYITLKLLETSKIAEYFVLDRNPVDYLAQERLLSGKSFNSPNLDKAIADSSRFYISYGAGDDISTWSGPYTMVLQDAKLNVNSDGVREIELFFVPDRNSVKVFTDKFLNDRSYAELESKFDSKKNKFDEIRLDAKIPLPLNSFSSRPLPGPGTNDKWNFYIRSLLDAYLKNLFHNTPSNNFLISFSHDFDASVSGGGLVLPPRGLFGSLDSSILDYQPSLNNLGIQLEIDAGFEDTQNPDSDTAKVYRNLNPDNEGQIDSSMSLKPLDPNRTIQGESDKDRTLRVNREKQANKIPLPGERIIPTARVVPPVRQNPDYVMEKDIDRATNDAFSLAMSYTWKANSEVKRVDTALAPLYTFYRGLRSLRKKNTELVLFEESDMRILKLLKQCGLIGTDESSIIIFGEKESVKDLIYPNSPYTTELPFRVRATSQSRSAEGWAKYSNLFYEEFFNKLRSKGSSYGETPNLRVVSNTYAIDLVNDNDLLFGHNVKNSNVLDVSFKNAGYIANLLNIQSKARIVQPFQNKKTNTVVSDLRVKFKSITEYVTSNIKEEDRKTNFQFKILNLLRDKEDFQKVILNSGQRDAIVDSKLIDFLALVAFLISPQDPNQLHSVEDGIEKSYADVLSDVSKFTMKASIKTLPFFNHPQLFERNCFLFGLTNSVVGSLLPKDSALSVFTGRYKIVGARHYLSNDDAYSNFELTRVDVIGDSVENSNNSLKMTVGQFIPEITEGVPRRTRKEADADKDGYTDEERTYLLAIRFRPNQTMYPNPFLPDEGN